MRWLLWTSKNLLGLDPADKTLRDRLASSINVLGTAAGLFLVIAVAALLQPPGSQLHDPPPQWAVDVYGICMLISGASYIGYIAFSLTVLHPILQSLRDDVLFDAYERYMRRWGGYDLYLFNLGLHAMICGLILACYILYSLWALIVILFLAFTLYGMTIFFSRECFLSLDPISAMHLGLTNNPSDRLQAEKLSTYLLHRIPNTILRQGGGGSGKEVAQSVVNAFNTAKTSATNNKNNSNNKKNTSQGGRFEEFNKSPLITSRKNIIIDNKRKESTGTASEAKDKKGCDVAVVVKVSEASLPNNLYVIFHKPQYLPATLSRKECEFIYEKLSDQGITMTEQLIRYLNDMKQPLPSCQCELFHQYLSQNNTRSERKVRKRKQLEEKSSTIDREEDEDEEYTESLVVPITSEEEEEWQGVDYSSLHHDFCSNRLSSCWLKAFELLFHEGGSKVSIHSINLIINFFKPFLR